MSSYTQLSTLHKVLVVTTSYILSLGAHGKQLKTDLLLGEMFLASFELSHAQAGRKLAFRSAWLKLARLAQ